MREWLHQNWFNLLQSIGILASILFTGYALRLTATTQRISNLFQVTQYHREIWSLLFVRPELHRIKSTDVDLEKQPISNEERLFVSLIILHLSSTHQAIKAGAIAPIEGVEQDVQKFFSLPIPNRVWHGAVEYQNSDFVEFVETCLESNERRSQLQEAAALTAPTKNSEV